jgi:hypothetical protein
MADRVLHISWGEVVRGREEHALEVFNESLGFYGRMQQEGRIEGFDVVLLEPSTGTGGYIDIRGSAEALAALTEDDDWRQLIADSSLIVDDLRIARGLANEGVAEGIARFQAAAAKVPQSA